MAKHYQIFKGGYSAARDERIAVNQRPADGHLKSATWEETSRLNRYDFDCGSGGLPKLEVGDVIQIHTGLTFGVIEALGIAVKKAEEGLKFKVVFSDTEAQQKWETKQGFIFDWDEDAKEFTHTGNPRGVSDFADIGNQERYYAFFDVPTALDELILLPNSGAIGLEVVALPPEGLKWDFEIETRLHSRQVVRPPAHFCCGC